MLISLEGIVWFVIYALIGSVVLGLLWWLIGYVESQNWLPGPAFKIIRVIFVVLVVLLLIAILMNMLGHPVIRLR